MKFSLNYQTWVKRKSAVTNRRRYLLEHLDGLIEKASTLSLDKAVRKLQEYKLLLLEGNENVKFELNV